MNVTSQGVIFTVPQICAFFVDNPNNLEIESFVYVSIVAQIYKNTYNMNYVQMIN
jgi:hypothetical protein